MSIINTIKESIKDVATEMKLIKASNKTDRERAKELAEVIALQAVLESDLEQAEREERAKSILAGQQKEYAQAVAHVEKLTADKKTAEKLGALATEQVKTLIDTLEAINKLDESYRVNSYDFAQVFRNNAKSDLVKRIVPAQSSINLLDNSKPVSFELTGANSLVRATYLRDEAKKALDSSIEDIEQLVDEQIESEKPRVFHKESTAMRQTVDMYKGTHTTAEEVNMKFGG
jgi:histidinol dehydrogenase